MAEQQPQPTGQGAATAAPPVPSITASVFGIAFVAAPAALLMYGPDGFSDWMYVYVAGGLGGAVFEATKGRGEVELPCRPATMRAADPADGRGTIHCAVDIGFFARLGAGALAALAMTVLYHRLVLSKTDTQLAEAATSMVTVAMALAYGYAAPKIWEALASIVASRTELLTRRAEQLQTQRAVDLALETLQEAPAASEEDLGQVLELGEDDEPDPVRLMARLIESRATVGGSSPDAATRSAIDRAIGALQAASDR